MELENLHIFLGLGGNGPHIPLVLTGIMQSVPAIKSSQELACCWSTSGKVEICFHILICSTEDAKDGGKLMGEVLWGGEGWSNRAGGEQNWVVMGDEFSKGIG